MGHKVNKKNNILLEAFDALFIMLLCFGTLLSAMLMQGKAISGMKYSINFTTLFITLLGLFVYLSFIIFQSDKGLKSMIKQLYDNKQA